MSRIYGERQPLDYEKVEAFFKDRSQKLADVGPLSVTMYQSEDEAQRRDAYEKARVAPLLQARSSTRVLDIGCGTGRWGLTLADTVASYLGADFCEVYVEAGRSLFAERGLDPARFQFQRLGVMEVEAARLAFAPPFDLIIVGGLLAFVNDEDARGLFRTLPSLLAPGGRLYLREPIALEQRLTLIDFPSDQLQQSYNAIYRTDAEMRDLFGSLIAAGAVLEDDFLLYPPEMLAAATRQETNQRVYFIRMPV